MVTTWKQYIEFVAHHERLNKPVCQHYVFLISLIIDPCCSFETIRPSKQVPFLRKLVTRKLQTRTSNKRLESLVASNSSVEETLQRRKPFTRDLPVQTIHKAPVLLRNHRMGTRMRRRRKVRARRRRRRVMMVVLRLRSASVRRWRLCCSSCVVILVCLSC